MIAAEFGRPTPIRHDVAVQPVGSSVLPRGALFTFFFVIPFKKKLLSFTNLAIEFRRSLLGFVNFISEILPDSILFFPFLAYFMGFYQNVSSFTAFLLFVDDGFTGFEIVLPLSFC